MQSLIFVFFRKKKFVLPPPPSLLHKDLFLEISTFANSCRFLRRNSGLGLFSRRLGEIVLISNPPACVSQGKCTIFKDALLQPANIQTALLLQLIRDSDVVDLL